MEWFSLQQIHWPLLEFCVGVVHFFGFPASPNLISPGSDLAVELDGIGGFTFVANVFAFERFISLAGASAECLKACKDDTGLHAMRDSLEIKEANS